MSVPETGIMRLDDILPLDTRILTGLGAQSAEVPPARRQVLLCLGDGGDDDLPGLEELEDLS